MSETQIKFRTKQICFGKRTMLEHLSSAAVKLTFQPGALMNLRTSKWIKQTISEGPQHMARLVAKALQLSKENEERKPVRTQAKEGSERHTLPECTVLDVTISVRTVPLQTQNCQEIICVGFSHLFRSSVQYSHNSSACCS